MAARAEAVTVITPSASFGASLPAERQTQLVERLRGKPIELRPLHTLTAVGPGHVELQNVLSGAAYRVEAEAVVIVGERCPRD